MLKDYQLNFNTYGTAQAETTVDAHISDNVYDTTKVNKSILEAGWWVFTMEVALLLNATGTFQVQFVCSAAAALTTPTVLFDSGEYAHDAAEAKFVISDGFKVKVPMNIPLRYIGCIYTIGTAVATAGSWRSFITPQVQQHIPASPLV